MDIIKPEQPTADPEYSLGDTTNARNMNFMSLKGYFGAENMSSEEEAQLNKIYDLVSPGARGMGDVLLTLRAVEQRIGATPLGQSRISHIYNYLSVLNSISDLTKQKQALEA